MSATARYALAVLAAVLVGAVWGYLVGGILAAFMGAFILACIVVVLVRLADPLIQDNLSSTYIMLFSSGAPRRDKRDD